MLVQIEVLNQFAIPPNLERRPIESYAELIPLTLAFDMNRGGGNYREDRSDTLFQRGLIDLMEDIELEALDDAITMSGGVMRELMSLMAKSARNACLVQKNRVTRDDVARAVIATRNEYTLYADHVEILKKVLHDPYWYPETGVEDPQSPFLELLHTLALLEYRNGEDKWRQPHPVLKKLLERPRVERP